MSDAVDHGITVTEIAAMDQPIDVCPETTAAFVGRALRGPLNTPVLLRNFGEFRRRFGDNWSRSSLGPAARQFFEHGGKRLYVVRVANNARGAMLCLPANGSALVLRAVEPGSTEKIRAAIDYDGLQEEDVALFNLTLQRVNPATDLVIDQEFYQRVSWQPESASFVADELLTSAIARVDHPYPGHRPELSLRSGHSHESTYIEAMQPGADGSELSTYDLIGSHRERLGMFALEQIEQFDLLYLPPPAKGIELGAAAVLAGELYCRQRGAMMIVDPLSQWQDAQQAVNAVRELGYASPNIFSYFPRVAERGDDERTPRAIGGAMAGLLCKQDRTWGAWLDLDQQGMALQRGLRPLVALDEDDGLLLSRSGLNSIVLGVGGQVRIKGSVTMGRGSETDRTFTQLAARRFCLQVVNSIARATRWAVFEPDGLQLAARIRGQILDYFTELHGLGAFRHNRFIVQCDAGVSRRDDTAEHGVTILLVFHPVGCDEPVSITLHQTATGCRVGSTAFGLTSLQP